MWMLTARLPISRLQRASEFMSTYFPDLVGCNLRMASYWARLEATVLKNVVAARGVWENLISSQ